MTWARDLAAMIQAALIGFWVGGSFLGLAYWDYPYILIAVLVLTKGVVQRRLEEASVPVESGADRGSAWFADASLTDRARPVTRSIVVGPPVRAPVARALRGIRPIS